MSKPLSGESGVMSKPLSGVFEIYCKCCKRWKDCRLFILQNGEAAWVCDECRKGKS